MDEHFLHYVWNHQKFDKQNLSLTNGEALTVFAKGFHNQDSGPDFEEGRVKIGEIEWVGSIEIHIRSSDWDKHFHSKDEAYENVVLHVVWSHDKEIVIGGTPVPTLELQSRVQPDLLHKYQAYKSSSTSIPCHSQLANAPDLIYQNMLDRVLVERLETKAALILEILDQTKNDWEEATYQTLARNFGFATNRPAFESLARILPFQVLKKNLHNTKGAEAIIFGQAGFLNDAVDEYQSELRKEYQFLTSKFTLRDPLPKSAWKFGKMRPANFPTVRLAQFAALLQQNANLFSSIVSVSKPKDLIRSFRIEYKAYWSAHYDFGKSRKKPSKGPGISTLDNLIINSVSPILAAYCKYTGDHDYMDRAISLLEAVKPEANRYTREWTKIGKISRSAFESQAQIQLIRYYCEKRKCLDCNIGVHLLGK